MFETFLIAWLLANHTPNSHDSSLRSLPHWKLERFHVFVPRNVFRNVRKTVALYAEFAIERIERSETVLSTAVLRRKDTSFAAALVLALLLAGAMFALGAKPAFASGTVGVSVQGRGDVTGTGINCNESGGPDCSEFYANTTYQECDPALKPPCRTFTEPPYVEFTAGPDRSGYTYDGWTGCDTVTGRVCGLTVNSSTTVIARFRDVQPPAVSIISPTSGVQRGTINFSASASDNSGSVSRVDFLVGGVLIATDTSAPYSASFDTTSKADGTYNFEARAYDGSGNMATTTRMLTIDNTAPTLSVTSGPAGQTFGPGSTQTWNFSASDATSGLQSVQCSVVATGTAPSFGACSGGNSSHSVSNLAEGNYTFAVRALDNGGLETTQSRTFSIDATAPAAPSITNPANNTRDNDGSFTLSGTAEPNSTVRIFEGTNLKGTTITGADGAWIKAFSAVTDGSHTYTAKARDTAGNTSAPSNARTVIVDTIHPTVISTSPAAGATGVPAGVNITATFSEAMKASTINGATVKLVKKGTTTKVAATVSYSAASKKATLNPSSNLARGATYVAMVTARAKDLAGNSLATNKTWSFKVQ